MPAFPARVESPGRPLLVPAEGVACPIPLSGIICLNAKCGTGRLRTVAELYDRAAIDALWSMERRSAIQQDRPAVFHVVSARAMLLRPGHGQHHAAPARASS
jgi:hypothetical protein